MESIEEQYSNESMGGPGKSPENVEATMQTLREQIVEIDKAGESRATMGLKRYLGEMVDDEGRMNHNRVRYFEKMTNRAYADFLVAKEAKENERDRRETDPLKRRHFETAFAGRGYRGTNYLEFDRIDHQMWKTSEVGIGYTTTAKTYPEWLQFADVKNKRIEFEDIAGEIYYIVYRFDATLLGMPVSVREELRRHENGECGSYRFTFASQSEANTFAHFLDEKEREAVEGSEKINMLWTGSGAMLNWEQLGLVDRKYELFNLRFGYYGNNREFFSQHGISRQDFEVARSEYGKMLGSQILELTEDGVEQARKEKPRKEFKDSYAWAAYLEGARKQALRWEDIERLLEGHEEAIVARAKEIKDPTEGREQG